MLFDSKGASLLPKLHGEDRLVWPSQAQPAELVEKVEWVAAFVAVDVFGHFLSVSQLLNLPFVV